MTSGNVEMCTSARRAVEVWGTEGPGFESRQPDLKYGTGPAGTVFVTGRRCAVLADALRPDDGPKRALEDHSGDEASRASVS
jgi:hypothetical protein